MLFLIVGLLCAVVAAVCTWSTPQRRMTAGVLGFFIGGMLGYFFMPTLAWNFVGFWFCLVASFVIAILCSWKEDEESILIFNPVPFGIAFGVIVVFVVVAIITSAPVFHSGAYQRLAGEIQPSEFDASTVSPVDISQVRIVDQEIAQRLGEKRLGEIAGLGSRVTLGTMNIQKLDGSFTIIDGKDNKRKLTFDKELYWVGPLYHSGIFKQWGNGYTDGYVMVSATDTSKSYLVTGLAYEATDTVQSSSRMGKKSSERVGVEDLKLRYFDNGGYFGYHVPRHLKNNGYISAGLTDYSFEIDNGGHPYWVVTKFEKRVGFGGSNAVGVVTVDVQTGEIEEYSISDAPEWIDRIQPESFILEQLQDNGEYVHGWWNPSNRDKVVPTPGASMVMGADGRLYLYTGIQSVGSDTSTTAFVLVDVRTKDVFRYDIAGANEQAVRDALSNAPGAKEAGYMPSNPIVYNVAGEPAYFATLKGSDGVPKMYGFVSLRDYTIMGVGASKKDAFRKYGMALRKKGGQLFDDLVKPKELETKVLAVTREAFGETLYYYFILDGVEGKEFFASTDLSPELKWTKVGNRVKVSYNEGEVMTSINFTAFDNLEFSLQ